MTNVALSSPHEAAIECCLGCLGRLSPSHWRWLAMNHAPWGLSLRFLVPKDANENGSNCWCARGRSGVLHVAVTVQVQGRDLAASRLRDGRQLWIGTDRAEVH